ncbi:BnaAnng20330D [Brassica napus]|uniref:BnaAnng20330D protein n=1 Tax=Brassica napus TaxID=3708 RepID=A0A078JFH2_BRANA|nr:BnaAnng20330D [Brassica napus]
MSLLLSRLSKRLGEPAMKTVLWLSSSWDHNSAFADQLNVNGMFRMPGSGGHLIGSWDRFGKQHKFQRLKFKNLPELTKAKRELLCSCSVSEHLVESRITGETFLVKWFRKATPKCLSKMKTRGLMVFKIDEEGKAVYTQDIGYLNIFISKSEAFCDPAIEKPSNFAELLDFDEMTTVCLDDYFIASGNFTSRAPYFIPPQNQM